jgi:ATP-dependent helicase/DNAse subunit B
MLTLIRSASPCLPFAADGLPAVAQNLLQQLQTAGPDCLWIVPTGRRTRYLERTWLARLGQQACLTPTWMSLEGFVQDTLSYSRAWRPSLGTSERLLVVARAWEQASRQSAGAGLLHQLDRFQRDCQAVAEVEIEVDRFKQFNRFYRDGLVRRGRLDRMASLRALTEQLRARESGLTRLLARYALIVLDGFHRFEPGELDLIANLAQLAPVAVWLAAVPGQTSWRSAEFATRYLQEAGVELTVCDAELPAGPFAALGRRLFPVHENSDSDKRDIQEKVTAPSGLALATARTALEEVEQLAVHIKADVRRAQASGSDLRLSEIAVVIPGPAYDPLIREVLDRAGLTFNLAGRALDLAGSRPARLLLSAIAVIRGQWRADLLLDFLMQPVVRRSLVKAERLHALFDERPRRRQRLDYGVWRHSWRRHLQSWSERLKHQEEHPSDDDDAPSIVTEREALDQSTKLVDSLEQVLAPVVALERSLEKPADGAGSFLVSCIELLDTADMAKWLTPPDDLPTADRALWMEYHKDQQAYNRLLTLWRTLATIPKDELPRLTNGHTDWMSVAALALANETYQIRTDDDAGVQVFEIREIRGLKFRHVYMLGLVGGQFPSVPEEGALADLRRQDPRLALQLDLKEAESAWLFTQLFEAAQEKLVLSRPCREAETPIQPSLFLTALAKQTAVPVLETPAGLVNVRAVASRLGRRTASAAESATFDEIWPNLEPAAKSELTGLAATTRDYRRSALVRELALDLPALLPVVLSDQRAFSPSELEKYAACPFRFFGTRLLRLQEREGDTTRLQYGSFIHRVLEKMYIELRARTPNLTDEVPLQAVRAAARDLFGQIFETEWQALPAGLLPQELSTLFQEEGGVVDSFLDILGVLEEDNGLGNLCTEFEFKDLEIGQDSSGRPVLLTGIVDRVDLDREDPVRAFVFDYKTGKARSGPERKLKSVDGRLLQLALYGYAVGKRLNKTVAGAAYLYLNEKRNSKEASLPERIGEEGEFKLVTRKQPLDYDVERARQKALGLASTIRAGKISLTTFSTGKYSECSESCAMRSACREEVTRTGS